MGIVDRGEPHAAVGHVPNIRRNMVLVQIVECDAFDDAINPWQFLDDGKPNEAFLEESQCIGLIQGGNTTAKIQECWRLNSLEANPEPS
ncbi:MAG: hypothetical protein KIT43_09710 [Bauldia sp.]|nr:hypothetical protein [Bauldia sp.]